MVFIESMCVITLVHVVITISCSTFHFLLIIFSMRGWKFSIFAVIVSRESLSLYYVNSMN